MLKVTKLSILYWQEIPTVVEGKDKEGIQKVELSKRFTELVDMVAMRKGLVGTDEYLENWKKKGYLDLINQQNRVLTI